MIKNKKKKQGRSEIEEMFDIFDNNNKNPAQVTTSTKW